MKIIHRHENNYTLNFEPGDELMAGLLQFAKDYKVEAAHITGLGAASAVEIAFYDLQKKEYERKEFAENLEIVSLLGNIGVKENKEKILHIHGSFGRRDFSLLGGHVFKLIISGAGEIHLAVLPGIISRAYDKKTGLTLMCPSLTN